MAYLHYDNVGYTPPEGPELWQAFAETGREEDVFLREAVTLQQLMQIVDEHPVWVTHPGLADSDVREAAAQLADPYRQLSRFFRRHAGASSRLSAWSQRFRQAGADPHKRRKLLCDLLDAGLGSGLNPTDLLDWENEL